MQGAKNARALTSVRRACDAVVDERCRASAFACGRGDAVPEGSLGREGCGLYERVGGALPPRTTRKGALGAVARVGLGARADGGVSGTTI